MTRRGPADDDAATPPPAAAPSPWLAGLTCRCPRCGDGRLFDGFLTPAPRCSRCKLDFAFVDSGDGPAVFGVLLAGFAVVAAALYVEVRWQPPYWLHAVIWLPVVLALTLGTLRPLKGLLIALQYRLKAREARLDEPSERR